MVAMIMNGSVSDHSWGQSHYEGLQKTAKELNLDVSFHENIPADTNALVEMEKLIASGARGNIVFVAPDRGDRYFSKGLYL